MCVRLVSWRVDLSRSENLENQLHVIDASSTRQVNRTEPNRARRTASRAEAQNQKQSDAVSDLYAFLTRQGF